MAKRHFRDIATKTPVASWPWHHVTSMRNGEPIPSDTYKYDRQAVESYSELGLSEIGLEEYIPEPKPEPEPSTNPADYLLLPFQFYAMLEILGKADAVDAAVDAIPDLNQRAVARAKIKHSASFSRNNPLFDSLKVAVGLTDDQIDAAWLQAKDIV